MKYFNGKAMEMKMNHGLHRLAVRGALRLLRSSRFALTRPDRFAAGASMLACLGMLLCGVANAATVTATTEPFGLSIRHNDTWYPRTAAATEAITYSTAWATNALEDANAVVKVYPVKRNKPKYIAIDLSGGTAATHYPIEYLDEIPGGSWSDEYKTSKLVLRHIPAGSFVMGGRATDYPGAVNTNLHMVTLTKDFYMGVFEVTQRQWELVMGNRPSAFTNEACYAKRPVEQVSYIDVRGGVKGLTWPESKEVDESSFMGRLRNKSGLTAFDLPTEAQWEYACRAGTATALGTGNNITAITNCPNVAMVARYSENSGWAEHSYNWPRADFANEDSSCGTAYVGLYTPNDFGLYDMHGNVFELVCDVWSDFAVGEVDPVGVRREDSDRCIYRGGSWRHQAKWASSANRNWCDIAVGARFQSIGFRLCLQGGEIPETTAGTVLVNASGEGTANWTPTKAGTYYLTHETQTNGVNGAELLGAWFEVAGPELTIEPQGELTNGVAIAINGAGDGWTVYYTTDGSEPTSSSTLYEGAFSLSDSATVRAVAISAGGVSSDEATVSFTLHPPLSVNGVVARQRWPWNGMVDIDATVTGDPSKNYIVTLTALHTGGSTNLPIRTAWVDGGSVTNNTFVLTPGQYRFTWNADADIAGDFNFGEVEFGVSVADGALTDYAKKLSLTVDGYAGSETLTNVPVLVRLSTAINGFSYDDFADANGGDLIFTDEGETTVYPYEIDEWHVGGESLVWVKLPMMANGTKFKMAYGNSQLTTHNSKLSSHEVWRDYAGVWHMNEDSGTAFDSTAHGLDALPSCGTNEFADVSQMVAYENGACGRARVNMATMPTADNGWMRFANYMIVPSYDGLCLRSRFSVSGWVYGNVNMANPRFVSRKNGNWDECGWEVIFGNNSNPSMNNTTLVVHGAGDSVSDKLIKDVCAEISDISEGWVFLVCLFDGETAYCYNNGVLVSQGAISPATDNGLPLLFGQKGNGTSTGYNGQYDEIRLRGGLLSADRIKADYDMIANRDFISFAAASNESGLVPAVSATDTATLDVSHDGIRDSLGDEALTYSSLWNGGDGATVTIAQDGAALLEGLTGEGERAWSVTRNGTYVLTHTTYTNGVAGKVETATFVVTGKDVPFAAGDVTVADYSAKYDGAAHGIGVTVASGIENVVLKYATAVDGEFAATLPTLTDVGSMMVWCEIAAPGYITQTNSATVTITKRAVTLTSGDASKVYDGTAVTCGDVLIVGDGFVAGEGATFNVTGSQTSVGTSENAFTYTLNEGTKAGNYDISTVNGTLAVTKASVGPGGASGGEEPGGGDVPQGGESKFDVTVMYDGEGHTIDTNALVAAFGAAVIGEFVVEYAEDDGSGNGVRGAPTLPWGTVPAYTNAGEYVVWYRVSNPNYDDFIHAAKVTITNRPVTVTSADGSWTYDGQAHSSASVSTEGFVDGEGVVASNFATITGVGSVANAFDYAFADGTLADNYAVTCVTGTLSIVAATIHYVADNVTGEYNGTGYGIDVSVSAPASGATVKFAESAEGPWLDSLAYVGVCEDRPIYFQVSATGYTTAVDSRTVTVTPKTLTEDYVWLVLPWEDYVYDGTAKEPEFTCGDGDPSIITLDDFDVSYLDNIDAGTATAVFTGKGNYTGTVTEEFDIWPREVTFTSGSASKVYDGTALMKHEVAVSGDGFVDGEGASYEYTGSQMGVGASENTFTYTLNDGTKAGNYDISTMNGTLTVTPATIHYVADNVTGEYNGAGYGIDVSVSAPASGATVKFAESAEGPWLDSLAYVDVCEDRPIYFQVSATGYTTAVDSRTVTVTPKTLTEDYVWLVLPWEDYVYDGTAKEPEFTCGDGDPSIITLDDFDVSYLDNIDAGTATAVFTGKGNYTGTVTEEFDTWPREVTFTSGSASKVYDGTVLVKHEVAVSGDGFIDGEGVIFDVTGSQTDVGSSENAFTYTLNEGTKASNYDISTVNGTLTVTKASAGGEGGEEPGDGEVPEGGESKFDVTAMYDGEGHTIDTNALVVAFGNAVIGEFAVEYAADDGSGNGGLGVPALPWGAVPIYTNAGEYVVWYRVSNPNYDDYIHAAKVTITNRPVTVTSADGSWTYDGQPHSSATVSTEGFVDGEGVVASNYATITDVGSAANSFGYVFADGTLAENYLVTCVTGTLTVVAAGIDGWTDEAKWTVTLAGDGAKYDGTEKTCEVAALAYDGFAIPTFTVAGNTATDAGDYTLMVTGTGNFSGSHTFPWSITRRAVTLTSGDASKVYNGTALVNHTVSVSGDGFAAGEGASCEYTGSQVNVGTCENTFIYTLNDGTKASNYDITAVNGTLTVTKASAGGEGGEEPGDGEVPQGGESKFDVTAMYDGEGHTIDTNALAVAFIDAVIGEIAVEYAADDGSGNGVRGAPALPWGAVPIYTNAGEYVVWYRVSNPNYDDYIHAAKVTITNRPVTVTSVDGNWTYDGQAHSNATVTAEGFVDGEGVVANNFATITDVGSSANAFTYVFADGTLAENYAVTCVTGTLTVTSAGIEGWTDDAKWSVTLAGDGAKYDGTEKTCEVTALAYDGFAIPTFTVAGNTAADAGGYTLTVTGTGNFSGSHTFPWSIVKREVTLTSGDASKVYDGTALVKHEVAVSGDGFVEGESASYNFTGSQTSVGTSENTFTYTLNEGTKAGNYDISTVNGTLTVTRASINPTEVFGGEGTGDNPLVCEKTFNGAAQPVEVAADFAEPYQFLWALTDGNENAYSATAPTLRNVADGELTAFFKFVTANYQPYYGKVVFRILAKKLTDEMVVLSDEAFYYDPGSTVKKPSVTVADTNALGEVISTANDYTVAYEDATAAGAIPVTVTAKNNYTGTVTKTFPVLKRPVAPPVIGTKAYNGRTQKATVAADDRWTVVRNNGGINVGEYEVVLRLTNTDDYCWKGIDAEESDWTGVFRITKANNGWSRKPGITGWTSGETPNEPVMGQARYGTVQVAYRRKGTGVSAETATKPSTPGTYIARFWVDATENYIGVALSTPYEVEFEIAPGAGGFTETQTTPVPVPYVWLDPYLAKYGSGDYEAAGHATGANGVSLWESYVAGLNPEDPTSKLRAFIEMLSDNTPKVTWSPDLSIADVPRTYTILGKAQLTNADWTPVTDANKPQMRFFKVKVEIK